MVKLPVKVTRVKTLVPAVAFVLALRAVKTHCIVECRNADLTTVSVPNTQLSTLKSLTALQQVLKSLQKF
ncbi:hypothetical protein D3C80_1867620 [compost metagenome]